MPINQDSYSNFDIGNSQYVNFYSLPSLEQAGIGPISRLPVSIRIVLESILRNCDNKKITEEDIKALANWNPKRPENREIPFIVSRVVLQDFTGVPLLVDLAAMRSVVERLGKNPAIIEPLVPVDLVVDHSVQVDYYNSQDAFDLNLEMEFVRNRERYQFLKWGQQAFKTFGVIPPGIGIVHQVNLEYLAKGVIRAGFNGKTIYYPDTLVGTDSHTTMINGLGIVGWGVGGIEAEAAMLGQPVYFLTPEVVGVHLHGKLEHGVTATDLILHITKLLREVKVVGKFVEFYGEGAAGLSLPDRATISNMAPEYGATMGYFPVDEETVRYLRLTGRSEEHCIAFENYFRAQALFGMPDPGKIQYSQDVELCLSDIEPAVAGPRRPQDRIALPHVKEQFQELLLKPVSGGGFGKEAASAGKKTSVTFKKRLSQAKTQSYDVQLSDGSILIAAITSCTNTSNPSVMIGAGLLAKKAVELGLSVNPSVKTSMAPGSRVVQDYLEKAGLQQYLDALGFNIVGYGCTTCIGNSGPLNPELQSTIDQENIIAASVLSGNRNFEARIHSHIRANFLMSPPLVVAFALAGRVDIDLSIEPIGVGKDGKEIFLKDLWPRQEEIRLTMEAVIKPEVFQQLYRDFDTQNPKWNEIPAISGQVYIWDAASTYIQEPPFFIDFSMNAGKMADILNACPLGIFGDSVTTDHISPAGSIKQTSPAGRFLIEQGVEPKDFNSYGSRRGNDRVMTRGTFANVRIKNLMLPGTEGGVTRHYPSGDQMDIYDAAMRYKEEGVPLVIIGGHEYGTGSSRDWAAKGTALLGVKAVIACSYERIHRSNLIGMGVLPLQFEEGTSASSLELNGSERFSITGLRSDIQPQSTVQLEIQRANGQKVEIPLLLRIDTPIELEYYRHGGILPYVLRSLIA